MNKKKKKMIDYGRYGYFFIAPFFITDLVFQLWPLINTFYYSTLTYYKRNGREFMEFAGLQNFVNILGMAAGERGYVLSYLKNTLVMWGCNFVPQILVSASFSLLYLYPGSASSHPSLPHSVFPL